MARHTVLLHKKATPPASDQSRATTSERFFPVDVQWQRNACDTLHLNFRKSSSQKCERGQDVPLTIPNRKKRVVGDGNCLFRSFSYIITGSENYHREVRKAIVDHMPLLRPEVLSVYLGDTTVQEYQRQTRMRQDSSWGTDVEMVTLAHLLDTTVYAYSPGGNEWAVCSTTFWSGAGASNSLERAMYLVNTGNNHYDVVRSVRSQ